jgi:hypothetical protein
MSLDDFLRASSNLYTVDFLHLANMDEVLIGVHYIKGILDD